MSRWWRPLTLPVIMARACCWKAAWPTIWHSLNGRSDLSIALQKRRSQRGLRAERSTGKPREEESAWSCLSEETGPCACLQRNKLGSAGSTPGRAHEIAIALINLHWDGILKKKSRRQCWLAARLVLT